MTNNPPILGGMTSSKYSPKVVITGIQPPLIGGGGGITGGSGMVGGQVRAISRHIMRSAMNSISYWSNKEGKPIVNTLTPFRLAMNAGDPLHSLNSGPSPKFPKINQLSGTFRLFPVTGIDGVHLGNAGYTGNPKHVYDSSTYTKYKSLSAKRKNYNAYAFGGKGLNGRGVIGMTLKY